MYGKIVEYEMLNNKLNIKFERGSGTIEVVNPKVINVFSPLKYDHHNSKAIENFQIEPCEITIEKKNDEIILKTEELIARVYDDFKVDFFDKNEKIICKDYRGKRNPFQRRGVSSILEEEGHILQRTSSTHKIEIIKEFLGEEKFYGLGETTGHLNKRGYDYEMWNSDIGSPHVESFKSMYKSIPFFIALKEKTAFGIFFDNTFKTYFDMGKENAKYYYFGADDGNLDYYFILGPQVKDVIKGYTKLTGTTNLPPMWALGYQQSRYAYVPENRLVEVAKELRDNDIPCDVLHLDIDYMDGYRVFTWDKTKFPNPKEIADKLTEMGFKIVTIIDPGVKKDEKYSVYKEGVKNDYFATDVDGEVYINTVWPGESAFPDFSQKQVRQWWGNNHKVLLDSGVSGIWNDMNEPASFNGPLPDDVKFKNDCNPIDHSEIHNVYGQLMSKATYEGIKEHTGKRPFVITRACYAGIQKYSAVWTGDNQSFWEHLRMSVPMLLNLGLSGVAFSGTDVGGFSFDCTKELLCRWVQVGCFSPFFRNHSSTYTRDQEPWAYDAETLDINRKYIKFRYKFLPYLYDLMWSSAKEGIPVMRPLLLHYGDDERTHEINDQFLWGENVLVAPILEQGKKFRAVYLPEGNWVDYWTKETIEGSKVIIKEAALDTCPIYIKQGSILPNYIEQNYIGEKDIDELILDVYPGNGQYIHYQDDCESFNYKEGEYNLYKFEMIENDNLEFNISSLRSDYNKSYTTYRILLNIKEVKNVYFNGKEVKFDYNNNRVEFVIPAEEGLVQVELV